MKTNFGDSHPNFEFAEIFEAELIYSDLSHFFALRDTYYEIIRNALRHGKITKDQIILTCNREPKIDDPEIKAYAAATAKYYLHKFGIDDVDIPKWIDATPPCEYLTPIIINAFYLKDAAHSCPKEFLEKNVLVCERDFTII